MKVKEFYDYITAQMTPEQALMKLLEGSVIQYEKLKFDEKGEEIHPVILISMAAMDLGWQLVIEGQPDEKGPDKEVRGIAVGTKDYMDEIFFK